MRRNVSNELIPCGCGCGKLIHATDKYGRRMRFHIGHCLVNTGRFQKGMKHTEEWKKMMSEKLTGIVFTEERKRNISLGQLGKKMSEESKRKMAAAKIGKIGWETNRWKGDAVGNTALHTWVRKFIPKSETCGFCHKKKKLQLANMTGMYNRDFANWKYLCAKCHVYYDGTVNNLIIGRKILHARARANKTVVAAT
jgi:hypothetical protein